MTQETDKVRRDIFQCLEQNFGIAVHSYQQIQRGWRNLKWKLNTNKGQLFVKQYHPVRYPIKKLERVKRALRFQAHLSNQGIPCPKPFQLDESYLITTPFGTHFVLTDYCEGNLIKPGEVNLSQMYHLGQVTAKMHMELSKFPKEKLDWQPIHSVLVEKWKTNWNMARLEKRSDYVLSCIESQREILDRLDTEIFHDCEIGWTHWDLFVDNLLFLPDKVSAILDFDRIKVIYPELDISRAVMSCALKDHEMNLDAVSVFLEGYNEFRPFTPNDLARSIKLLWCHDSPKWIRPEMEERPGAALRFVDEVLWITNHWDELEELFSCIPLKR